MDLVYLIKILKRRIRIIIAVPILAGIASFYFTSNLEDQYKSSAQLAAGLVRDNKVQLTKEHFDYWESVTRYQNMVQILKSDLVGSMVTYNLLLHDLESDEPFRYHEGIESEALKDSIKNVLVKKVETFTLLSSYDDFERSILDILNYKYYKFDAWLANNNLVITRIGDTDFIKVDFTSENPFLSAFIVNNLCEEYIRYNAVVNNAVTEESVVFFSREVEKKKRELDNITEQLNAVKKSSQVFNYDRESTSKIGQVTDLEIKLQEEENKNAALGIALKSIDSKIAMLTSGDEGSTNAKLLQLKNKINELNKIYTDGGSTDKALEATINDLRNQLQTEMQKVYVGSTATSKGPKTLLELKAEKDEVELELAISNSNIASIRSRINSLKGNVSTIGSKEYTIASLERERDNAFNDYTNYIERLNEAKSKSLITGGGAKLIIAGQPSAEPEPSLRLVFIALAVVGSLSLCVGLFIVLEFLDNRLKTPDKFERYTKVKLLGYLNKLSTSISGFPFTTSTVSEASEVELMMHLLRKIRYNIEMSDKRVLLVTSTNTGDGKSFFIKTLAQSLSLLNKRVLIVDTNFRNNSLTQLILGIKMLQEPSGFKLLNDPNLRFEQEDTDTDKSIIFSTSDKNVEIMGCKQGFESPSELFSGRDFKALIDGLKHKYDYILMEGPGLNGYSDTKELEQFADGVITIYSAKNAMTQKDRDSIKYLKSLNGKFIGAVLNFVQEEELHV